MGYYKQMVRDEMLTVKHSMVGLTNDSKKDANSVKAFEDKAIETMQNGNLKPLIRVNEFTDGCASQCKGRNTFHDNSKQQDLEIVRNFDETNHVKSVCDGIGAQIYDHLCCHLSSLKLYILFPSYSTYINIHTYMITVSWVRMMSRAISPCESFF